MSRRTQGVVLVGGWLFSAALFVFMYITYYGTKLSYSEKFPGRPCYGAMTGWFFVTIPVIGFTWGYVKDVKNRGGSKSAQAEARGDRMARRPLRAIVASWIRVLLHPPAPFVLSGT